MLVWFKRAPDLHIAFVSVRDGPEVATITHDRYKRLVTPSSLKTSSIERDKRLSVSIIVLEYPLQVRVMVNSNNDRVDIG